MRAAAALAWLATAAAAIARPLPPRTGAPCQSAVFSVAGPPLGDAPGRGDLIRIEREMLAIRDLCPASPARSDRLPDGDLVMRAYLSHCAGEPGSVSVWLRIRADCRGLVGRLALRPSRRIRIFEAARLEWGDLAWPPRCVCETPHPQDQCEVRPPPACDDPAGGAD